MIMFADELTRHQVWSMWKKVFGDSDEYMNIYFRDKYADENTLLFMDGDKAVSSLQMLDYYFTFHGNEIPVYYLSGLCTLPEYRGRGYMKQLILKSFEVAAERKVPLVILVPQEEWLIDFYDKYGFVHTFEKSDAPLLSVKDILINNDGDLEKAYYEFDKHFNLSDMTVQKSFEDFLTIEEELRLFGYPNVTNLTGMSRIIDLEHLLMLFANTYRDKEFDINVEDEFIGSNSGFFRVNDGVVSKLSKQQGADTINIRKITQLLLGFNLEGESEHFRAVFPQKNPQMNMMLE
ncbi:MAG: GNAT family N-acetyltransferase [Fermentimonas sp.]|jgi:predicted acetyltransferase